MSTSTDGLLLFGIAIEEGATLPWADYEEESWWRTISGYVPPFDPYTEDGEYADGFSKDDPRIDQLYAERRAWDESHPMPIEVVNICSGDYQIFALAVRDSVKRASRGYPEVIDPALLVADPAILIAFCKEHGIEYKSEPAWLLASYWG